MEERNNWTGKLEGPWKKAQAKGALRKKRTVRRRNAFWVRMGIKGGFKLLERVTREGLLSVKRRKSMESRY